MSGYLPSEYTDFVRDWPEVARAHEALADACHRAGPLDARTRHLVKLGVATALQLEGAVKSHCRQALDAGASAEEVRHAVMLSLTTSGFSRMIAALGWVGEVLAARKP